MNGENFAQSAEDLSQEQWWLILWSLITDSPTQEWNEFTHDLIYKNRFSSSHNVIEVIKRLSEVCTLTIPKGQILYRARIYHQDPLREFLSVAFKDIAKEDLDNIGNIDDYFNLYLAALLKVFKKDTPRGETIINAYNNWQKKQFKGYNSDESGAPPANNATSGRLNPERIRYLYLAEDPQTAVYEVKPTIGQHVSVATFKTMYDIRIYDLSREINPFEKGTLNYDYVLFNEIQKRFSEPNTGDAYKYLPTQFLGELIKQMGFDGLRFKSAVKNGGINIVLFDDMKCKAIRSDLIKVSDIELKLENPEIYQLEELIQTE